MNQTLGRQTQMSLFSRTIRFGRRGPLECVGTVFLVDGEEETRNSTAWILRSVGRTVETFASPQELLASPQPNVLACYVLDLNLPGMSGLALERRLSNSGCRQPFIFLSECTEVAIAVEAMRLGAVDFIERPFGRRRLLDAVQAAIERDSAERDGRADQIDLRERLNKLTRRESEVLDHVVVGRLSKQIARDLAISPKTVEVHRSRIMRKLGVESLAQLLHTMIGFPRAPAADVKGQIRRDGPHDVLAVAGHPVSKAEPRLRRSGNPRYRPSVNSEHDQQAPPYVVSRRRFA